jgi:ketosteroid isomerase-like protein
MNTTLRLISLLAALAAPLTLAADPVVDAVRSADDARVAATVAGDPAALGAVFSDDLVYTHSSGTVNDKAAYTKAIVGGHPKYLSIAYEDRQFRAIAPGIVLMSGRCTLKTLSKGQTADIPLSFLAVWRQESGAWRLLAWHSTHLTPEKS